MEQFAAVVSTIRDFVWNFGIPVGDEMIPIVVIALIGTGFFLTFRLGFVQIRRFGHGVAVATGKYDDPDDAGDVTHFQALTTALSATVGIGNIAGVAIAIHWGGPGALFWMWLTAAVGMATKYTEVTLAQKYRDVHVGAADTIGSVSGGPMYYIEKGLGSNWRWMAMFFAIMLGITALPHGERHPGEHGGRYAQHPIRNRELANRPRHRFHRCRGGARWNRSHWESHGSARPCHGRPLRVWCGCHSAAQHR